MIGFNGVVFASVRRAGRVVVFTLLAWTAADVLNPALCGLDELPSMAATMAVGAEGSSPVVPRPAAPPDDCFCCSHNVKCTAIVHVTVSEPVAIETGLAVEEHPRSASFPLYHPPRFLS